MGTALSASAATLDCLDDGRVLSVDNERVVDLKKNAPLGRAIRAHVSGRVTQVFADRSNHAHFEIELDASKAERLEVVYSEDFGQMPNPSVGAVVQACGDFINAYAKQNGYPPSPSGAIIHWVHQSNGGPHDSGFVILDNVVYGTGADSKGPRRRFDLE